MALQAMKEITTGGILNKAITMIARHKNNIASTVGIDKDKSKPEKTLHQIIRIRVVIDPLYLK